MALSPLNQRRLHNFRANRRAYWSLVIFAVLYILSLGAELIANDKPLLVKYDGGYYVPFLKFYPERAFGGDFQTEAKYSDIEVRCLIASAGSETCFDDPEGVYAEAHEKGTVAGEPINRGWILSAPIPYSYTTISDELSGGSAPSPPDGNHLLGTDDTARDVAARIIYGFRLSVTFALIVTLFTSIIGIAAGAVQGYFGGIVDLVFQRVLEVWSSTPQLYIIIIIASLYQMNFWLLIAIMIGFGWTGLVGVVRAEFLRARNFEYVRAAKALGVSDARIMARHVLPNAMVATLTFLPFIMTGTIGSLAGLDYLGFGLPSSSPSLGEMALQAKQNLQAPWLAISAFITYAVMLSLLVFVFEGVRDAFDPRKTFR